MEDDRLDRLRLLRSRRVGPATYRRLIHEHGSARAALAALPEIARAAGVPDYRICPEGVVAAEIAAARRAGAQLLVEGEARWPDSLSDSADAPPLLWARGDPALLSRPMVALVGARSASSLGLRMARRMAADLSAAGHVVVSGLARGIDAAAHEAALDGGTVAVLAGGADRVYPPENATLAQSIAERGLILSEQPMGTEAQARHFPARNRIVAGLGRAVVVIEAAAKSGSLITARQATEMGREVLAVPGHPLDARAAGCNILIRDGATLARSAEDVIEAIGAPVRPAPRVVPVPAAPRPRVSPPGDAGALHRRILDRLGPSPIAEDQLIRDLGLPTGAVAPALVDLELDGRIERAPGGLVSLRA